MAVQLKKDAQPRNVTTTATTTTNPASASKGSASGTSSLWEDVAPVWTPRAAAVTIYGDSDTGRSTLALTAPGPIAYFHSQEKIDKILEDKSQTTLLRQHKFGAGLQGSTDDIQRLAEESISRFERAMSDAYTWARTIVIDTESRLWELYQLARLGSMVRADRNANDNKKGQLIYTEINARWSAMLQEYKDRLDNPKQSAYTNLILICKTKDEYKKNHQTGKTEASGKTIIASQKNTWFFSDVVLRTQRKGGKFSAVVEKPWWNPDYRDHVFSGEDGELEFPYIMTMITETATTYWE